MIFHHNNVNNKPLKSFLKQRHCRQNELDSIIAMSAFTYYEAEVIEVTFEHQRSNSTQHSNKSE